LRHGRDLPGLEWRHSAQDFIKKGIQGTPYAQLDGEVLAVEVLGGAR
jgi:hypothetical protein